MSRFRHIGWLLLALALLGVAPRLNESVRSLREDLRLTQADPLENAPPLVAFTTVAFGGFRGILADLLWLRAGRLQEEGRYFELVQLADWITKLEPRFTPVWAYQAWNLAYNISVLFNEPEDRWRWVSSGVTLLRDEGLKYNPGDARLLYELGWIFQHKIGGNTDQMHLYYKQEWAREMGELFSGPRPDFAAVRADPARLQKFARYKLDPSIMETVEAEFGPLDWRLPQAHAIYWAFRSRQIAEGFDAVSAERMIFQSMADALREGSLFVRPEDDVFILTPNLALLPRIRKTFRDAIASEQSQESFKTAHRNFLTSAIVLLYTYNRVQDARSMYSELRELYPDADNAGGFEPFVLRNFASDMKDLSDRDATGLIEGCLYQSLFWQAMGDSERATGFGSLAQLTWNTYMALRTNEEYRQRTGLPPLLEIRQHALDQLRGEFPSSQSLRDITDSPAPAPQTPPAVP